MTQFAGWEMPLFYDRILSEHRSVRASAGLFDLGHMGRIEVTGADRAAFLDRLSTNRLTDLAPGRARYTVFAAADGGTLDDLVVSAEADRMWVVPNAGNRPKIVAWLDEHAGAFDVVVRDRTGETGILALQGPKSQTMLETLGVTALDALGYFRLRTETLLGETVLLSRTGYTGEDGFEILAASGVLASLWTGLLDACGPLGLVPAGLGARDTLRVEAGLCLYGHELTETLTAIEAGLGRFVKFKGRAFVGKAALRRAANDESEDARRRVGLELDSRRIARHAHSILADGRRVGRITSGTFAPTLEKSVAMGYVPGKLAAPGTTLVVRVSHEDVPATVVPLPFYSRRT